MNKITLAALLCSAAVFGCSHLPKPVPVLPEPTKVRMPIKNKVLLLGLDGVRPDALQSAKAPNLEQMAKNGAYNYKAVSGYHTWSGPEWSNILTGVWENKHGVTDNSFKGANYEQYLDLLTRLENKKPELYTVSLVSWEPLNVNIINIADKKVYYDYEKDGDKLVTEEAISVLSKENPDVMFVYFADVDIVGHDLGFGPKVPEYMKEIEDVDRQVGLILEALKKRPTYGRENWLVLAVTDHGGIGKEHGMQSPEERTVFYLASGPGASFGEIIPAPKQVDVVPTIFRHLDLEIDPSWNLDGEVSGLRY